MNLTFSGHMKPAPAIRPLLNIGCLFDIQTGRYHEGKHGEMILNGGLALLTGFGGRGNTYKSTLAHYMSLAILDRYSHSAANIYDTELSATIGRFNDFAAEMPFLVGQDLEEQGRLLLTDAAVQSGEEWFDEFKKYSDNKVEKVKEYTATLPFLDKNGKNIKVLYPSVAEIDSLSRMPVAKATAILDANQIGESGNNTEAMRNAMAKHQMLIQMPVITAESQTYVIMTAHVDDAISIDAYSPPQAKLAFLNNKLKFKYVPNQFFFLMNNLWYCFSAKQLKNQTTKAAEYPFSSDDKDPENTDLMIVTVQNLRGKYGASGAVTEIIVSQTTGVIPSLTEFHYLKSHGRFGLGGSDRNYYLELCPDVSLQRTTVRQKLRENAKLRRATEIMSEMCQIKSLWQSFPKELMCDPKTLYEDLKKQGYDWDMLLSETRGYWTFEEDTNPLKFLSTYDLLRMRAIPGVNEGKPLYRPYWLK